METKVKGFEMPQALGQQIINYLAQRPFAEVEPLINGMRQMKECEICVEVPGLQAVPSLEGEVAPKTKPNGEDTSAEA